MIALLAIAVAYRLGYRHGAHDARCTEAVRRGFEGVIAEHYARRGAAARIT
jgi:hypothetical protein